MSRIALDSIPALTFYKNALTNARRTSPIAQLVCVGKPCSLYQPEVVRCTNIGGSGVGVDWKCEADLPSSLRFGKVEVSCEGWSGPGDPYVMKGSCALEYHLIQLPNSLRDDPSPTFNFAVPRFFRDMDAFGMIFMFVWLVVLALLAFSFIDSCRRRRLRPTGNTHRVNPPSYPRGGAGGGRGGGGDGGGGSFPFTPSSPPPPYSKDPPSSGSGGDAQWRPGFWTGAALGAFANHLWNRRDGQSSPRAYDWERERMGPFQTSQRRRSVPAFSSYEDRGEGPSSLGAMRTSTGYGGSVSR
ncbi:DUF1183-domain-containing protein [Scleroderma citrinum]